RSCALLVGVGAHFDPRVANVDRRWKGPQGSNAAAPRPRSHRTFMVRRTRTSSIGTARSLLLVLLVLFTDRLVLRRASAHRGLDAELDEVADRLDVFRFRLVLLALFGHVADPFAVGVRLADRSERLFGVVLLHVMQVGRRPPRVPIGERARARGGAPLLEVR